MKRLSGLPARVLHRLRALFGGALRSLIRRFGFDLVRQRAAPASTATADGFYNPGPTCQVPNLGFLYELVFGQRTDGLVVEVGAFDGVFASNSMPLIEVGWRAVLVEPVPEFATLCESNTARFPEVQVVNVAIGSAAGTLELARCGTLTTADRDQLNEYSGVAWAERTANSYDLISVPMITLDQLLVEHGVQPGFEVLVVDVEGFEEQVLKGFDVARWRPRLMIWELSDAHPDLKVKRPAAAAVYAQLLQAGYRVLYKDAINTVLVRDE